MLRGRRPAHSAEVRRVTAVLFALPLGISLIAWAVSADFWLGVLAVGVYGLLAGFASIALILTRR